MSVERIPGYYWIRSTSLGDLEVAHWDGETWWLTGDERDRADHVIQLHGGAVLTRVEEPEER